MTVLASVTPQEDSPETPPTLSLSRGSQSPDDNYGKLVTEQRALETLLPHRDGLEPNLAGTAQVLKNRIHKNPLLFIGLKYEI